MKKGNKKTDTESYTILATFFGIGNSKRAPGTMGSLAALPIWILYNNFFEYFGLSEPMIDMFWLIFLVFLFFVGANAADLYSQKTRTKDSSSIVIDEVLGQLITLFLSYNLVSDYIYYSSNFVVAYLYYIAAAFLLFRLFDILKPSFVGLVDKKIKNGYGVMLDDVFAGVFAAAVINLTVIALIYFSLYF